MTYKQFATQAKNKNPKITQPELERAYTDHLKNSLKSTLVHSTSKEKQKPQAATADSNEAQKKHAFRLALMKHALRPVPSQAMIAAAHEKFPVMTFTQTGRTFVNIPQGSRLFLSPSIAGEWIAMGFVLPTTNAVWNQNLNDNSFTRRVLQNVLSSDPAAASDTDNFYNASHPYFLETGPKEIVSIDGRGTDLAAVIAGSPSAGIPSNNVFVRQTLASMGFDVQVACTYLATALVSVQSTDDPSPATREIHEQPTNDETAVGVCIRNRLSADTAASDTGLKIAQASDIDIVGPGQQRHYASNVRLCKPFWHFTGWADRTTVSNTSIQNGMWPDLNPWTGAYATGSYICVEAVGGAVSVCLKAQRTNHCEYILPTDNTFDTSAAAMLTVLGPSVHYTSTDPIVMSAAHAPLALTGSGSTTQEALRDLDRQTGVPIGSHREVISIPSSQPHPAPSCTAATDLWGEVKGVSSVVADVAKAAAKGVSFVSKAKGLWSAASDIGEFAEGLGMLL